MATVITPDKKPLFQKVENSTPVEKKSFFQNKKKIFIVIGLLLFIALVVGLAIYFLQSSYTEQLAEKIS